VLALAALAPAGASAQSRLPWLPPAADSLQRWASEAKVRFREATGDTVGGPNFRAYELVGMMGRRLLRAHGPVGQVSARRVAGALDSLGLEVELAMDEAFPNFMLLMVRNPYRRTAHAVGFLYWYLEDDLRMQGTVFFGGLKPVMRAWWTGIPGMPYSIGVIDRARGWPQPAYMSLLRLIADGRYWSLVQYRGNGPDLSPGGEAAWVDINTDDRPELVAWVRAENDTLFESCRNCPAILHEFIYTESEAGFDLHDMRVLPSPYSTFTLFIRLLADGNRAAAARLLKDPQRIDEAIAAGWGSRRRARAWSLEYAEDTRWPRWLAFLHHGPRGDRRYIVRFEQRDGRWILSDWVVPRRPDPARRDSVRVAPAPSAPGGNGR
jgi:hypothetical protein